MSEVSVTFEPERVSVEALAHLGEGHIAYVKQSPFRGRAGAVSAGAENRARAETVRAACRRRHPDHADRQP